jgi:hypothetical protein
MHFHRVEMEFTAAQYTTKLDPLLSFAVPIRENI